MTTIPMPLMNKLMTQSPTRKLLAIAICGLGTLSVTTAPVYADDDGSFWTQFVPSADTRLIFVSSEEGNDNNSGLNPNTPVKTLARGYELLRDGYPDWMLLKRGDVWYESFPFWTKGGRAEDEKLVVGAYGEPTDRPQIRPDGNSTALTNHGEEQVAHVAFVGLHLEPHNRLPSEGAAGISWLRESEDILFEDIYIDGFNVNISLQAWPSDNTMRNIRLNGCVVVDAWNNSGHSQGLYASKIDELTIENCVFDHNGWNVARGAYPTIYNHNVYLQHDNGEAHASNNIFLRGAATGIQMRSGGQLLNNLFIANPIGFQIGAPAGYDMGYGVNQVISNNTILHGTSIQNPQLTPRSIGGFIYNAKNIQFSSNILANNDIGYNGQALVIGGSDNGADAANIAVSQNTIYNWHGDIQVSKEESPSDGDRITISNNRIVADLTANGGNQNFNKSIIRIDQQVDYYHLETNFYMHYGMHNSPFKHGTSLSTSQWQDLYEPNCLLTELATSPASLTITSYLQHIGRTGGIQDFAEIARSLSRTNSIGSISPDAVYSWFIAKIEDETN